MPNEAEKPKRKGSSGLIFVGCLLGGLGIDFLTGSARAPAGLFIGMAVGFIAMAIIRLKFGEW
ncbi:hypothetical protein ACFLWB_02870 [Chloroflexota bacterium]